jgi:hypothetical protein
MRSTFDTINPREIVDAYDDGLKSETTKSDLLSILWTKFGPRTIEVMADGAKLLALLWESAWREGNGDKAFSEIVACDPHDLVSFYVSKKNLASYRLTEIDPHLRR